jgi:hypothetical protein
LGESEALIDPCDAATLAQLVRDENLAAEMQRLTQAEPCRSITALETTLSELPPGTVIGGDQFYGEDVALGHDASDMAVESLG